MTNYRYTLEQYTGRNSRHTCPACGAKHRFTRYVDTETGKHLADHVGRCDREVSCGYHYKPKQYFEAHPDARGSVPVGSQKRIIPKAKPVSFHTQQELTATLTDYENNHLIRFLNSKLGKAATQQILDRYYVGTSHYWDCSTVFWQVDIQQRIRAGKVMMYYPQTGRRIKTPRNYISWMHRVLKKEDFNLSQCFFGEHLAAHSSKPIAIVESEKTALVASHYMTEYTWLATGSLSNLTAKRCEVFEGRQLLLFPDVGAYDKWTSLAEPLPNTKVSHLFEQLATEEQRTQGCDLADFIWTKAS